MQNSMRVRSGSAVIASILLACCSVFAVTAGSLTIDRVEGAGWVATGISVRLNFEGKLPSASAQIQRVRFTSSEGKLDDLTDLRIECGTVALDVEIACNAARVKGVLAALGAQDLKGQLSFDRRSGALKFALHELRVAKGVASLRGAWREQWTADIELQSTDIDSLRKLGGRYFPGANEFTTEGQIDAAFSLTGRASAIERIEWRAGVRNLTANNASGTLAAEKLHFSTSGTAQRVRVSGGFEWAIEATLSSRDGQAFAEPIFMNLAEHPLSVTMAGTLGQGSVEFRSFRLQQPSAFIASGSAKLTLGEAFRIDEARIDLQRVQLPGAYALYAQPWLLNGPFGSLTTTGTAQGIIEIVQGAPTRVSLRIDETSIADVQERFSFAGMGGAIDWQSDSARVSPSTLNWRSGRLLRVEIGNTALKFATAGRDFTLLEPIRIPVVDGAIRLAEFDVRNAARDDMTLIVDGEIEPISVRRLCEAFGWPQFGGSLGGRVKDLRLRDRVLTLGTNLQADIFGGQVRIADLKLEQPFGQWPRFAASIGIEDVDLEQVTTAFSFGRITGRLSGTIDDLQMFNWMPVAFDARLYTPSGDRSRHRISQRAVDSIGRLGGGGGMTAALSTGFLKFFEEFNYERLGINCRLSNGVCNMGGIEPATRGYYLVKGRGVPRIDVIGNATRVDWPRMVAQLKSVTRPPEVEVQ